MNTSARLKLALMIPALIALSVCGGSADAATVCWQWGQPQTNADGSDAVAGYVTGYEVYLVTDSDFDNEVHIRTVEAPSDLNTPGQVEIDLRCDAEYCIRVRAIAMTGETMKYGPFSEYSEVAFVECGDPGQAGRPISCGSD